MQRFLMDTENFKNGKKAEEIVRGLLSEAGFRVVNYGYEHTVKELADRNNLITGPAADYIRHMPDFVVFNGHGDSNTVTGHNDKPIMVAGENEVLLKSKIVYAISCSSAKELGKKSVKTGAISYTGYDNDSIFLYEPYNASRPLKDKTARLFLEPSNLFIMSMLKGNTVTEAREKTENMLKESIKKLLGSNVEDASFVRYLWWDLKHFVSHGSASASLP